MFLICMQSIYGHVLTVHLKEFFSGQRSLTETLNVGLYRILYNLVFIVYINQRQRLFSYFRKITIVFHSL